MKAHVPQPTISDQTLITHVRPDEVGRLARSGAVWSAAQIIGRNIVSVASTAVLARLLAPEDYGLMGMVATVTALLQVFADMGLSWATIQRQDLTSVQLSNLFWVNTAVGAALALACVSVSPYVARFYERQELLPVTIAIGLSFLLGGLSVQPFALMRRRMQFRTIAEIEIAAAAIAMIVAVAMAVNGFRYWALVSQIIVAQAVRAVWALQRSGLQVRTPLYGAGTRSLVQFGGLFAINGFLIYLSRTSDSVLVGRVLGAEALGYYDRAYFLMLLPSFIATGVLTNMMVPSLSALRSDPMRFGAAYRRAVRMVAFVGCPMAVGLALTASECVQLMYGEKWRAVAPLLCWLSIAGVTQPVYNTTGWLFTAAGKPAEYLALTCGNALVLVLTFALTVAHGVDAVAAGYGLVMGVVLIWPAMWFAHRATGVPLRASLKELLPVGLCCLVMAIAVLGTEAAARVLGASWHASLGLKIAVGVFSYGLASHWLLRRMVVSDLLPLLPQRLIKFCQKACQ